MVVTVSATLPRVCYRGELNWHKHFLEMGSINH